jgi:hypothetical protein
MSKTDSIITDSIITDSMKTKFDFYCFDDSKYKSEDNKCYCINCAIPKEVWLKIGQEMLKENSCFLIDESENLNHEENKFIDNELYPKLNINQIENSNEINKLIVFKIPANLINLIKKIEYLFKINKINYNIYYNNSKTIEYEFKDMTDKYVTKLTLSINSDNIYDIKKSIINLISIKYDIRSKFISDDFLENFNYLVDKLN